MTHFPVKFVFCTLLTQQQLLFSSKYLYKNSQKCVVPKCQGGKDLKSKVAAKNGCDNISMEKTLILTIQVYLCVLLLILTGLSTKFTWVIFIKIFTIERLLQLFFDCYLWFDIFFYPGVLGSHTFSQLGYFCVDITFLYLHIHNAPKLAFSFGFFFATGVIHYYEKDAALKFNCFSFLL